MTTNFLNRLPLGEGLLELLEPHLLRVGEMDDPRLARQGLISEMDASQRIMRVVEEPDCVARQLAASCAHEAARTGRVPFVVPWDLMPEGSLEVVMRHALGADKDGWEAFQSAWKSGVVHPVFLAYARGSAPSFAPWVRQGPLGLLEDSERQATVVVLLEDLRLASQWERDLGAVHPTWHRKREAAPSPTDEEIPSPNDFSLLRGHGFEAFRVVDAIVAAEGEDFASTESLIGLNLYTNWSLLALSRAHIRVSADEASESRKGLLDWCTTDGRDPLAILRDQRKPTLIVGLPKSGKTTLVRKAVGDWLANAPEGTRRMAFVGQAVSLVSTTEHVLACRDWLAKQRDVEFWLVVEDLDELHDARFTDAERAVATFFVDLVACIGIEEGRHLVRLTATSRHDDLRSNSFVRSSWRYGLDEVMEVQIVTELDCAHGDLPVPYAVGLADGSMERIEEHPAFLMLLEAAVAFDCRQGAGRRGHLDLLKSVAVRLATRPGTSRDQLSEEFAGDWDQLSRSSLLACGSSGDSRVGFRLPWVGHGLAMLAALEDPEGKNLGSLGWRAPMLMLAEGLAWRPNPTLWPDEVIRASVVHQQKLKCGYGNYAALQEYLGDTPHHLWLEVFQAYYVEADYTAVAKRLVPIVSSLVEPRAPRGYLAEVADLLPILVSCLADLHLDREAIALAKCLRVMLARRCHRGAAWFALGGALGRVLLRRAWEAGDAADWAEGWSLLEQKHAFHEQEVMMDDRARDINDLLLGRTLNLIHAPKGLDLLPGVHQSAHIFHDLLECRGAPVARSRAYVDRNLSYALLSLAKDPEGLGRHQAAADIRAAVDVAIEEQEEIVAAGSPEDDLNPLGIMRYHRSLDRLARGQREEAVADARRAYFCFVKSDFRLEAWLASRLLPEEGSPSPLPAVLEPYMKHRKSVQRALRALALPLGGVSKSVLELPSWPAGHEDWPGWLHGRVLI